MLGIDSKEDGLSEAHISLREQHDLVIIRHGLEELIETRTLDEPPAVSGVVLGPEDGLLHVQYQQRRGRCARRDIAVDRVIRPVRKELVLRREEDLTNWVQDVVDAPLEEASLVESLQGAVIVVDVVHHIGSSSYKQSSCHSEDGEALLVSRSLGVDVLPSTHPRRSLGGIGGLRTEGPHRSHNRAREESKRSIHLLQGGEARWCFKVTTEDETRSPWLDSQLSRVEK